MGRLRKISLNENHKDAPVIEDKRLRFETLLKEWKAFHYLTIDYSTKQTYERKLRPVEEFLSPYAVDDIAPEVIDQMIRQWKTEHERLAKKGEANKQRFSYEKELDALKVVLNFYRHRKDPRFPIPIYREHYRAAKIVTRADHGVKSLKAEDLGRFLNELKNQKNEIYFPLALTQFCLSLRISEACALYVSDIDLNRREVLIQRWIVWDHENWKPMVKDRPKNGKARLLAIPEILAEEFDHLLRRQMPGVQLLFHDKGEPLIRKSIGLAYNRTLKSLGINYVSGTHLMRKTSATQANAATGDFHAVSMNLGHSNVEETQRYVEGLSSSNRKVANALDDVVRNVMKIGSGPQWPTPSKAQKFSGDKSDT
jgi:integrase